MNLNTIYRQIAGETLLIPIRSQLADMQNIFALNPAAEYIWQQLDGKQNLENIHRGITDNFQVETRRAHSDLEEFISQLLDAGIIEEKAGEKTGKEK